MLLYRETILIGKNGCWGFWREKWVLKNKSSWKEHVVLDERRGPGEKEVNPLAGGKVLAAVEGTEDEKGGRRWTPGDAQGLRLGTVKTSYYEQRLRVNQHDCPLELPRAAATSPLGRKVGTECTSQGFGWSEMNKQGKTLILALLN